MGAKALSPFKLNIPMMENISSFSLKVIVSTEHPLGTKQTQLIASKFLLKSRGCTAPNRTSVQHRQVLPSYLPIGPCLVSVSLLAPPHTSTNAFPPLASPSCLTNRVLYLDSQAAWGLMACLLPASSSLASSDGGWQRPRPRVGMPGSDF